MDFYKIDNRNSEQYFKNIGAEDMGAKIISKKANTHLLYIKDIAVGAANILKQDALSIGADLCVPRGTIVAKDKYVDAILVGSTKHFEILSKKELAQPFGLKNLAKELKSFTATNILPIKIMGVINANDDSFFSNSRFQGKDAIDQIDKMIQDGANIIDIGAVSSKPGSVEVDPSIELERIKPICDEIKKNKLYEKVIFSIDSYTPSVIEYALESGFTIVNDITGLEDDNVAKVVAKYDATIVIMHMQNKPQDMQDDPQYDNIMIDLDNFFKNRIEKAKKFGISKIVLDVGIGFGKTLEHNLTLLKHLSHFKHFGYELLIGASRKSMIDKIVPSEVKDRLPGTLAIHLNSIDKGASIIRCHDVKDHFQAIELNNRINNFI